MRARARVIHREGDHNPIDAGGKEISGRKDNDGHPHHRKIEQPVAHYRHSWLVRCDYFLRCEPTRSPGACGDRGF